MAYIRAKKAKRKNGNICEYAYIVENYHRKRGNRVKQKVKKYLGRVYRFEKVNSVDFLNFLNIENIAGYLNERAKEDIVFDLIKVELFKHGFEEEKGKWLKDDCVVNLNKRKVCNFKGNNVALGFNEGFLTSHAIRKILNFKAYDKEDGYDLAKMFVEGGLEVPKDIFVGLFSKALNV